MFTGIVEATGRILAIRTTPGGRVLSLDAGIVAEDAILGASIAINGVCLTVTRIDGATLDFDVIQETVRRTNLHKLHPGDRVNLERALKPDSRLDGHFVQGHVDGQATVADRQATSAEWILRLRPDADVMPYIIPKGSVALDGVSLTIAEVAKDSFTVAFIPTTLQLTTLADRRPGDVINIETDIIARTVVHHLQNMGGPRSGGLTLSALRQGGFA